MSYIETEEPAICYNKNCSDYRSWAVQEFKNVKEDENGYYYICPTCGEKIYPDKKHQK